MGRRLVQYYDLIYSKFKDYADECRQLAELLKITHATAQTILDVACGTGEHARILCEQHGYRVDGIDLEPGFIEIAKDKNPEGHFIQGDMTGFDLGQRYDVVLCLFSAIGYVITLENVTSTLKAFHRHLSDDGIVIVEPWFTPEIFKPGNAQIKLPLPVASYGVSEI